MTTDVQHTATASSSFAISHHFTTSGSQPYDGIDWQRRTAHIQNDKGETVFHQDSVEFPRFWSQTATDVVASKFFRGQVGTPEREWSVKQMIDRVADTIGVWGMEDGYFTPKDGGVFIAELKYILVNQMGSFNSPVWFNIGCPDREQSASACYILSVEDSMPAILEWYRQEGMIFTRGAGAGINISTLRAEGEPISKGGMSSGPLSFMRAADASAFSIKSGGTTRRSARMVVMDIDHPDIIKFIWSKAREEKKARALAQAGFDDSLDGEIYATVAHQNCNMSVRIPNEFFDNTEWMLRRRTDDKIADFEKRDNLLHQIAEACWENGEPGVQFETTINDWCTVPNSGRIRASNPCGEHLFLDNTACNLSSINLLMFLMKDGRFNIDGFSHTCDVLLTAQEILVSRSSYPTEAIRKMTEDFRPLGLGYANLGALLIAKGLPYDSEEGRNYAASITALMTGRAYKRSTELAAIKGPFDGFELNRNAMLSVIQKHVDNLPIREGNALWEAARIAWNNAKLSGIDYGYRNAQVTLLAPTGTISIMMDCDTTGMEPDTALVRYKKLVGGGTIKHVNGLVAPAMRSLGYTEDVIVQAKIYIERHGSLTNSELAVVENERLLQVLDCAIPISAGGRSISWQGHVKMVAALQPFLSSGISKTINMPKESTVEDIEQALLMAWKLGCKSIAIYRDGCKQTQVLTTEQPSTNVVHPPVAASTPWKLSPSMSNNGVATGGTMEQAIELLKDAPALREKYSEVPKRKRLPDERPAITHKFSVANHEGYLTVGLYENGQPAELFVRMAKEGSTLGGLMDTWGTTVSLALQYGVPLRSICTKLSHTRFEPSGFTGNKAIPQASSVIDYIVRWLLLKFTGEPIGMSNTLSELAIDKEREGSIADANICSECGSLLYRNGSCLYCRTCGFSGGCG